MEYIDLHTHTLHTDGRHTVEYVLNEAEKTELSLFSISDHNSVEAYDHIPQYRHLFSGRILPAVELTTMYRGEGIEILGYGIDVAMMAAFIQKNYVPLPEKQIEEAKLLARKLPELGLRLGDEFLAVMAQDPESVGNLHDLGSRPLFLQELRRFPENARFFESEEDFYNMPRQRWQRHYLYNPRSAVFVDQSALFPTLTQVIDAIHRAGGLAFLAHLFVYSPAIAESLDEIVQNYELDGLECHYGTFDKEQKQFLSAYCDAHGLYKSGGSDFHGYDMRPNNIFGRSDGERIELSNVADWLDKVKERLI